MTNQPGNSTFDLGEKLKSDLAPGDKLHKEEAQHRACMASLDSAVAAFEEALRGASAGAKEGGARSLPHATLNATIDFLREIGIPADLRAPLLHLLAALDDANAGLTNDILSPATYEEGTPKTKTMQREEWAMAAAAATILSKSPEWSAKDAIVHVAKSLGMEASKLSEHKKNLGRRPDGKKSGRARRASSAAVESYQWWLAKRSDYKDISPEAFVEIMLAKGRALAAANIKRGS